MKCPKRALNHSIVMVNPRTPNTNTSNPETPNPRTYNPGTLNSNTPNTNILNPRTPDTNTLNHARFNPGILNFWDTSRCPRKCQLEVRNM